MNKLDLKNPKIIIHDNPIARAYISILISKKITLEEVIFLINKKYKWLPNKLACYFNFYRNNHYALQLKKNEIFLKLKNQMINYFNLYENFYDDLYKFNLFYNISKKITFIKNDNINSDELYNLLKDQNSNFIYTGGGILKNRILNTKNKFFHIHPGYLPEVRGADGLLWSAKLFDCFGVSFFQMNNEIDQGKIIVKKKYDLPKFYFENLKNYQIKNIYRFVYSYIDPALRAKMFDYVISNFNSLNYMLEEKMEGNYYSFMNNKDIENSFKKFLLD